MLDLTESGGDVNTIESVRSLYTCLAAGDLDGAADLLDPHVSWTVMGRSHGIARTYVGRREFFDHYLGGFSTLTVPGSAELELVDVFEDVAKGIAVAEYREHAVSASSGTAVQLHIVAVLAVADGSVTAAREYFDLAELGSAVPV